MGCRHLRNPPAPTCKMKLTLAVLLLAVAFLHASAFKFRTNSIKGKIENVVDKAKDTAEKFAKEHGELDLPDRLDGAIEKAHKFIEKAKNLTEEERKEAFEKGKTFFQGVVDKVAEASKKMNKTKLAKTVFQLKDKVEDAVEKAIARGRKFMDEHNIDLNMDERLKGAIQKAKDITGDVKDMTEEEKSKILQKVTAFFHGVEKKVAGMLKPPTTMPPTTTSKKSGWGRP